jgi:hypothetical protein
MGGERGGGVAIKVGAEVPRPLPSASMDPFTPPSLLSHNFPSLRPREQKGDARSKLAISDLNGPAIHVYDVRRCGGLALAVRRRSFALAGCRRCLASWRADRAVAGPTRFNSHPSTHP